MPALEKDRAAKATLTRRGLLVAAPAGLLAACEARMPVTVSTTPKLDIEGLSEAVDGIAARAAPGVLGVGLMNLESGQAFLRGDDRPFPMAGVAILPLAAAAFAEIEAGRLSLPERITILEEQLSPGPSAVAAAWPGRNAYSVEELLAAAVVDGDTTAADVLLKRIGGPGAVTAFLTTKKVPGVHIDSYARDQLTKPYGMASSRPDWRNPAAYAAARAAVPPEARLAALRAYLADPRDSATPRGMIEFLQMLDRQELISPDSTRRLLSMMGRATAGAVRIRAGLPASAFLAHRPGTMDPEQGIAPVHSDVGIFTLADKRAYGLAVFLSGAPLDDAACDRIIADVTRAAVKAVG
jgi:beta-lactamase class A